MASGPSSRIQRRKKKYFRQRAASAEHSPAVDSSTTISKSLPQQVQVTEVNSPPPPPPKSNEDFDVRSILPDPDILKRISKLSQQGPSSNKTPLLGVPFMCIDGSSRTLTHEKLAVSDEAPLDTNYPSEPHIMAPPPNVTHEKLAVSDQAPLDTNYPSEPHIMAPLSNAGMPFKLFGVEAFPTLATRNEICVNFTFRNRCYNGSKCHRIHPRDKEIFKVKVPPRMTNLNGSQGTSTVNLQPQNSPVETKAIEDLNKLKSAPQPTSVTISQPNSPDHPLSPPPSQNGSSFTTKAVLNYNQQPTSAKLPAANPPSHPNSRNPSQNSGGSTSTAVPKSTQQPAMAKLPARSKSPNYQQRNHLSSPPQSQNSTRPPALAKLPAQTKSPGSQRNSRDHPQRPSPSKNSSRSISVTNTFAQQPARPKSAISQPSSRDHPQCPSQSQNSSSSKTVVTNSAQQPASAKLPALPESPISQPNSQNHRPLPSPMQNSRKSSIAAPNEIYDPSSSAASESTSANSSNESEKSGRIDVQRWEPYTKPLQLPALSTRGLPIPKPAFTSLALKKAQTYTYFATLHNHMKLVFGPGFSIEEFVTGFESPWVIIAGLPKDITDDKISALTKPYGTVEEIRRAGVVTNTDIKLRFSKASEASKAFFGLHGSTKFGHKLEFRTTIEGPGNGARIEDSVVRIDWEAPVRDVYIGYANEEEANAAVEKSKYVRYGDHLTTACVYIGIPAVGRVTVKYTGVPAKVTEEGMEIYGAHQGMVTAKPNYKDIDLEFTIKGLKRLVAHHFPTCRELEIRPPPYKDGKMRAWAHFPSSRDAKAAAENLHGRKPNFTGLTRILARHLKTVSFSLPVPNYLKANAELKDLREHIWSQGQAYSLSMVDKSSHFMLRLCGEDLRVLGRLKSELERILNGDVVRKDGQVVWDVLFDHPLGNIFLQDLERASDGVTVEKDTVRRIIRLFGPSSSRAVVRDKIIAKVAELQVAKTTHTIILEGRLTATFILGGFTKLQERLGTENVFLDIWNHLLKVRGDQEAFIIAKDAVNLARIEQEQARTGKRVRNECPVCFDEVSVPVRISCGHTFCRTCLQGYLKAAVDQKFFPLHCLGDEAICKEKIPLSIARELLTVSDFEAVINAAFICHVQTHPQEFHYCPTPDCPQVYRSAPEGPFIQCPTCLSRTCPACHQDAHDGLSCGEIRDGDDLFQNWASRHDVKQCPSCKIAIEKDEGCNHMMCTMCKTHICWVCMKTFPDGAADIYRHMRNEHGSIGLN